MYHVIIGAMKPEPPATKRARGRPVEVEGGADVALTMRVTREQKAKVKRNGGAGWVRVLIDRAKDKPHPG